MAYLPEFKHDIFVSYARVDDEELEPKISESRWVSMLLQRLEPRLRRSLHRDRVNDLSVFFDRRSIAPSAPLDGVILNALQSTAHLLIVLSERWLESPWCQQEIATVAQQPHIAGRISLVVLEDVPIARRPTALANLIGVSFGKMDPILKTPSVLGSPFHFQGSRDYQDYEDRLNQLVHDLASRLNQLRLEEQPNADANPVPTITPNLPDATSSQLPEQTPPFAPESQAATPLSGSQLNILFADVEPSLAAARCSAIGSLFARGHEVFATPTSAPEADKQKLFETYLPHAHLVLFMSGPSATGEPTLPPGHTERQRAMAVTSGAKVLCWHPPIGTGAPTGVVVCDQEEFTTDIVSKAIAAIQDQLAAVARVAENPPEPLEASEANSQQQTILIDATLDDPKIAKAFARAIEEIDENQAVDSRTITDPAVLRDRILKKPVRGLVVIYGAKPTDDYNIRLDECSRLAMKAGKQHGRKPACAIYVSREAPRPPAEFPARYALLRHNDHPSLTEFVKEIISGEGQP